MTSSPLRCPRVFLLAALILFLFPIRSSAVETVQLTQSQAITHTVTEPSVSPDGARVIFTARLDDAAIGHLYSVAVGGGPVTRLTAEPMVTPQIILRPEITADSQRVIFLANLGDPAVFELYSVPITGGTVTRLNGDLLPGGTVEFDWQLSPDGQRVIFRAEQLTAGASDLFSVSSSGGAATALTSLPTTGQVSEFVISPDSSLVAVISDQTQDDVFTLKSIGIEGGLATVISGPLVTGGDVVDAQFSPDSSTVLYRADQTVDEQFEIFIVSATGGPRTRLNDPLAAFRDVINAAFTPINGQVVFLADLSTDEEFELYLASTNGQPNLKISGDLVPGGDVLSDWQIDPVSLRVVYRADQDTDGVEELFSINLAGGQLSKLNGPLQSEGDVQTGAQIHGDRVFFLADDQDDGVQELFSTTLDGDDLVRLNDPIQIPIGSLATGVRSSFQLSDDEIFFVAAQDSVVPQLFRAPVDGGPVTKVNGGDGFVREFLLSPNGDEAFYVNDETAAGRNHLFQRTLGGLGPAIRLNDQPTSEVRGLVSEVQVIEDRDRIVYRASHLEASTDLWSRVLSGGAPVQLNGHLASGGRVEGFRLSPDGSQVMYVADQDTAGTWEIYLNDVDGGALNKLSLPPSEGGANATFPLADQPFTPDASRVVYAAFSGTVSGCNPFFLDHQLYSVSTSGDAPVRLNEDLDLCTEAREFEIGSTGERVVYLTFSTNGFSTKLFSVPVGGGPSTLLTDALSGSFALTPDASRVVFSSRDATTGHETIFSVPTAGGEPVPISAESGGVDTRRFSISNDGSRVVFIADQETAGQYELFSAPILGGAVIKMSGDLIADGDVSRFQLSPGLGRAVFLADKDTDDLTEIYSVSVQGGEVTRLNHDLSILGLEVLDMEISGDSSLVAFTLGQLGTFERLELHTVPLNGGVVQRVSLPLEAGEELGDEFEFSDDSNQLLYLRFNEDFDYVYFRAPTRGGLAQRFTPAGIDVRSSDVNSRWFSADGSQLVFAGEQEGATSDELWLSFELDLFRDGFELGDTSAWSNQMP